MNELDVVIIIVAAFLTFLGYKQGFILGFASLFGVSLGGVVGTRISKILLERSTSGEEVSVWSPLLGLLVGLLITVIGAMAMQDLGSEIKRRVGNAEHIAVDRALGAVLLALVSLVLVWFSAAVAIGMPSLRTLRSTIVDSRIVASLNKTLPPAAPVLGALAAYDPFPHFDGGEIDAAPPDEALPREPLVRSAARSVVRVVGTACGYRVTGSGWVAAPGMIVTNAHVIAGETDTAIQVRGSTGSIPAHVVFFDEKHDLAILRVAGLKLKPLQQRLKPIKGVSGAIIGFPENRGLVSTAARFDNERRVRAEDIYGRGPVERRITSYRGVVKHGNSGGPVVDKQGRVMTTVFAATVGGKYSGGYGVPNSIVKAALDEAQSVPENMGVRTGNCVS